MIIGDYIAKIAAQESFEDQLGVAEDYLSLCVANQGRREFYYPLAPDELERLRTRTRDIEKAYLQFESKLLEHSKRTLGRKMLIV